MANFKTKGGRFRRVVKAGLQVSLPPTGRPACRNGAGARNGILSSALAFPMAEAVKVFHVTQKACTLLVVAYLIVEAPVSYQLDGLGFLQEPWLHDGYLTAMSVLGDVVTLTARKLDGQQFAIQLLGTEELYVTDFKLGNIIFDIRLSTRMEVDHDRLGLLYGPPHQSADQKFHDAYIKMLDKKRSAILLGELKLFELSSSYGAEVGALCKEMVVSS